VLARYKISHSISRHVQQIFPMLHQPTSNQGRLIVEVSRPHSIRHKHTHTHTHTAGRTPLSEGSAHHKDCTTHNKQKRRTSIAAAGFEPAIPASKQSQAYALDRTTTGIGRVSLVPTQFHVLFPFTCYIWQTKLSIPSNSHTLF
jgi:hypothetical protein